MKIFLKPSDSIAKSCLVLILLSNSFGFTLKSAIDDPSLDSTTLPAFTELFLWCLLRRLRSFSVNVFNVSNGLDLKLSNPPVRFKWSTVPVTKHSFSVVKVSLMNLVYSS